ncbi:MAG: S26 family signal peptidase [Phycisphaerales bacterium]|nr:S26 family signal peptidase [Phycisphaerales bacterium]
MTDQTPPPDKATSIVDTLQSLLVAFVLAMVFRGFVVEGFVIPTGSMAPTLLGQHLLVKSPQTGVETPIGLDARGRPDLGRLRDHSTGRSEPLQPRKSELRPRAGDRVLVLKTLYPFRTVDRWDVTVFRNPTQPEGPAANFIKRTIGLPGESIWIVDGDIFVKSKGDEAFHIARKPDAVQKGVWQRFHDEANPPARPEALARGSGSPWTPAPADTWTHEGPVWTHEGTGQGSLTWDDTRFPLDDWTAYNMFSPVPTFPMSDLKVSATVTLDASASAQFQLAARSHLFSFTLGTDSVSVKISRTTDGELKPQFEQTHEGLIANTPTRVEIEHRDQMLILRLDGREVVRETLDWSPRQRLEFSRGLINSTMSDEELTRHLPQGPQLRWLVDGGAVNLGGLAVDRDLFHRRDVLRQNAVSHAAPADRADEVRPGMPAAATAPSSILHLKDDQYFMLGDNSGRSNDGRLWGWPHPMVAQQVDPDPFVVNEDLLVGKAFVVYYPAAHSITDGGMGLIPDFGRLRFIR